MHKNSSLQCKLYGTHCKYNFENVIYTNDRQQSIGYSVRFQSIEMGCPLFCKKHALQKQNENKLEEKKQRSRLNIKQIANIYSDILGSLIPTPQDDLTMSASSSLRRLTLLRVRQGASLSHQQQHLKQPQSSNLFLQKQPRLDLLLLRPHQLSSNNYYSTCSSSPSFEYLCHETLESLCEHLEILIESDPRMEEADVNLSSGVLNVVFPAEIAGTYVINKQTPNRQIWLSSPVSGPYRFDLNDAGTAWVYRHTGETLHSLLDREIGQGLFNDASSGFEECFMGANAPPS